MNKTLLLATVFGFAASANILPALSADLVAAPILPTLATAPSTGAYSLGLLYTGEGWDEAAGGLRRGTSYMQNMDAKFKVDMEKAFGLTGGQFVAEAFYASPMSTGNTFVGAINETSLIDTAADISMLRVYKLYYSQSFGSTNVRAGIFDLEDEFANTRPMGVFLNANFVVNTTFDHAGVSPVGSNAFSPAYPSTPLALQVRQTLTPDLSIKVAVADGVSGNPSNPAQNTVMFSRAYGAFFIGEADYTPDKYTKLLAGAWELTSQLPYLGQLNPDGSQRMIYGQQGAYVGGSSRLYKGEGARGLDGFITLGISTPRSTDVSKALDAGLVYTGLFDARPADKIGIAMNINGASNDLRQYQAMQASPIGSSETSFEATYRAYINDYLIIQPDIQYIIHDGYSNTIKNPVVIGVHFELAHAFGW